METTSALPSLATQKSISMRLVERTTSTISRRKWMLEENSSSPSSSMIMRYSLSGCKTAGELELLVLLFLESCPFWVMIDSSGKHFFKF